MKGDLQRVADIVETSVSLVKKVVNEERADYYNIQKVFSELLENREKLTIREAKRRERAKHNRLAA